MPSFSNSTFSSFFNRILQVNQSGNNGCDTITRAVQTGDASNTSLSLSDDVLQVKPVNDNTTGTLVCQTSGSANILAVDTDNGIVKAGTGQVNCQTHYAYFNINSGGDFPPVADKHYMIPFGNNADVQTVEDLGTGTNPDTSLAITVSADDLLQTLWYITDAIEIDSCKVFCGGDTSSTPALTFHLLKYDFDAGSSSSAGDLSNGIVLGDNGSALTSQGYSAISNQDLSIGVSTVIAGQVVVFTMAADATTADFTVRAIIKYHIY